MLVHPEAKSEVRRSLAMEPMFNNSSIAIRASVLREHLNLLEQLMGGEDSFLFYAAYARNHTIFLTSDRLTRYRVHAAAATAALGESASYSERLAAYRSYVEGQFIRLDLCRRIFVSTSQAYADELWRADLARWQGLRALSAAAATEAPLGQVIRPLLGGNEFRPCLPDLLLAMALPFSWFTGPVASAAFSAWRLIR